VTNQIVALKVMQKDFLRKHRLLDLLMQEIKIQSFLDHPNIVKLLGVLEEKRKVIEVVAYHKQVGISAGVVRVRFAEQDEIEKGKYKGVGSASTGRLGGIGFGAYAPVRRDPPGLEDGEHHANLRSGETR
jgi:hypothetical protein